MNTCPKCGLPLDLCMCREIARETQEIKVYTEKRRFGKSVTILEGIDKNEIKEIASKLKSKLACGGTVKEGKVELQGDHKRRIKEVLMELGFNESNIKVI